MYITILRCGIYSKQNNKILFLFFTFKIFLPMQCIFLTVVKGNCMVKLITPVNFCSDESIQTSFGTKLKDFLNYRIDYNSIS
jgi:hypothetical protein